MISAEEAKQLANDFKNNYRKQERIALENRITSEIEKAAREGKYTIHTTVPAEDAGYIVPIIEEAGYEVGYVNKREINDKHDIIIRWTPAENKKKAKSIAEELLKRLELQQPRLKY